MEPGSACPPGGSYLTSGPRAEFTLYSQSPSLSGALPPQFTAPMRPTVQCPEGLPSDDFTVHSRCRRVTPGLSPMGPAQSRPLDVPRRYQRGFSFCLSMGHVSALGLSNVSLLQGLPHRPPSSVRHSTKPSGLYELSASWPFLSGPVLSPWYFLTQGDQLYCGPGFPAARSPFFRPS
ncbi:hypothetical protein NDU88_008187 [Pleurodeles waltl]|uniref:Uncharacterized protein n=1 Tax=Pleurodeles waltl TaxID=8319 RepID=A0AAV7NZJ1_PLEWA|nr:hypothetical protein NDU88_008187 [Pleurodeles waltl]